MRLPIAVASVFLAASAAAAQVRDTPRRPAAAAPNDAKVLATGWSALAAGQPDGAIRAADELLDRRPWDHAATALRIEALSARDAVQGLDAYEKWLGPRTTEDVGLLEPVARAIVLNVAGEGDADLRREALRMLQEARVRAPAGDAAASSPADQLMADAALAAAGDPAATKRLHAAAAEPGSVGKTSVVQALAAAGPAGATGLMAILASPSGGPARGEAAAALGRLRVESARPALQQALNDNDPYVRSSAAVALARMGDDKGQAQVDRMLQSEVPDLQIMAAEAWEGRPGPWVSALMPLLRNPDGVVKLHAARLIAPVDPEAARAVFKEASIDPNPVIRAEAGAIAASIPGAHSTPADIAALRRLLRDRDLLVRLRAAGALLEAVRGR